MGMNDAGHGIRASVPIALFANDRELLAAFREGRRDALERVYRAYVRAVDRALRALAATSGQPAMSQPGMIDDLLQEVFVRAFSSTARRGYDGVRDFGPYLLTIARNCFVDAVRSCGRERVTSPEEFAFVPDADLPEPDVAWDPKVRAVLTDYVRELAPQLEEVYWQRFVLGRSQAEASSALGLSRGAIRIREDRLRHGLRKALVRAGILDHSLVRVVRTLWAGGGVKRGATA
jgi:RNA polymerase sigma-70 factor (ECF subfamily)